MSKIRFNSMTEFITPVGSIKVLNNNKAVPFYIKPSSYRYPYNIYSQDNKTVINTIEATNNYVLLIPTENLIIGKDYSVLLEGKRLAYNAGDENTISLTGTFNNVSIGIGAYNPNEETEDSQAYVYSKEHDYLEQGIMIPPAHFDESEFKQYKLDCLDNMSGYSFRLIDKSFEYVYFNIAWVENIDFDSDDGESAVDYWIS